MFPQIVVFQLHSLCSSIGQQGLKWIQGCFQEYFIFISVSQTEDVRQRRLGFPHTVRGD